MRQIGAFATSHSNCKRFGPRLLLRKVMPVTLSLGLLRVATHRFQFVARAALPKNPISGIAGCCARAASGHATTLPTLR
jgi:hypothetical protein